MDTRRLITVIAVGLGLLVFGLAAYLVAWPVDIEPIAWEPVPGPEPVGVFARNDALAAVNRLEAPAHPSPEDLHVLGGYLYGGAQDGSLLRWSLLSDGEPVQAAPEVVLNTGGRPLGLHVDREGRLIIADAFEGLLRLEPDGSLTVLCDRTTDGGQLVFTDDVDVAPDGTIWFTDASVRFDQHHWKSDILESRGNGRLVRWREGEGCVEVESGLYFPNGVAIAEDGSFLLYNETTRYRVNKRWLTGDKAGQTEVLVQGLPGFPDGISRGTAGRFWIAIASQRNAVVDDNAGRPFVREVIQRLPDLLKPAPTRYPYVMAIDGDGRVLATLQDPLGRSYGLVTSVEEHRGRLFLGSLTEPAAGWVVVPEFPQ